MIQPETNEKSRIIIDEITAGISNVLPSITTVTLTNNQDDEINQNKLKSCERSTLIALGPQALEVGKRWSSARLITGLVSSPIKAPSANLVKIGYSVSPNSFLRTLKRITPSIKHVHVIHRKQRLPTTARNNIRQYATALDLTVTFHPVDILKHRAKTYQEVVQSMHPDRDALWIHSDTYNREFYLVLNWLLKESWNQRLTIFSSNLTPVKRGALFSLYPDNFAYGQQLAQAAQNLKNNHLGGDAVQTSEVTKLAINRVALRRLTGATTLLNDLNADVVFPILD